MHRETGTIYSPQQMSELAKLFAGHERTLKETFVPMTRVPTKRQLQRGKVGRNDLCPCGSGKKFKKCCLLGGDK